MDHGIDPRVHWPEPNTGRLLSSLYVAMARGEWRRFGPLLRLGVAGKYPLDMNGGVPYTLGRQEGYGWKHLSSDW
jgi:hypothetical protein